MGNAVNGLAWSENGESVGIIQVGGVGQCGVVVYLYRGPTALARGFVLQPDTRFTKPPLNVGPVVLVITNELSGSALMGGAAEMVAT